MTIRAMNDFVFVRKTHEVEVSPGGIFLGEQEYDVGVVVACGPGVPDKKGRVNMWGIEPGQSIAFSRHGNQPQRIEGEELVVLRRDSIIGVVEAQHASA